MRDAPLVVPKARGKGPKGKRQVRLLRAEKQTTHEMRNRSKNATATRAKRDRSIRANIKTLELLVRAKDGML